MRVGRQPCEKPAIADDAEWTVPQWTSYLSSVDTLTAATADVEEGSKFLHSLASVRNAGYLDGKTGAPTALGPRGILRRAVRASAQAAEVQRRRVLAVTSGSSGVPQPSGLVATASPGDGQSALALTSAIIATSAKIVDLAAKFQAAHMGDLHWPLIPVPVQKFWHLLATDTTAARVESLARTLFLHVGLT